MARKETTPADMLMSVAMGREKSAAMRKVTHTSATGDVSSDEIMEQRYIPPDAKLLKELAEQQVGGPQDWC